VNYNILSNWAWYLKTKTSFKIPYAVFKYADQFVLLGLCNELQHFIRIETRKTISGYQSHNAGSLVFFFFSLSILKSFWILCKNDAYRYESEVLCVVSNTELWSISLWMWG